MQTRASSMGAFAAVALLACGGNVADSGPPQPRDESPASPAVPAGSRDPAMPSGRPAPDRCASHQTATIATKAASEALRTTFLARNGAAWAVPSTSIGASLVAHVDSAYRTDAFGSPIFLGPGDAETAARALVAANWDVLGLRSRAAVESAVAEVQTVDASFSGGGFVFSVLLTTEESQAAYAAIEGASQRVKVRVDVAQDGTARQFSMVETRLLPLLSLRPVPEHSVADALVHVLGAPMAHTAGPFESFDASFDYGPVMPADVVATRLVIEPGSFGPSSATTELRLLHAIDVAHEAFRTTFYVDACTNEPF